MTGSRKRITVGGVALSFVLAIVIGISGVIAPGGGAALAASTTLTIIDGEVLVSRAGGPFEVAEDGAVLGPGDVIRTAVDARAVLTYFEGSTVAIEPSSELAIDEAHGSPDGSTVVVMTQNLGRTWHVVTKLISGGSKYEVRTPAATASVRGTAFEVGVERAANGEVTTRVATTEGLVAAAAPPTRAEPQPEPVVVAAGFQTNARSTERKPDAPTLAPEPDRKVTVTIGNANTLVVDPLGRANGFKDGKLVIQTPGAQVTRIAGTLQITLPNLPDGKLSTVVQRPADGTGTPIDVPVITTVTERGKAPTLVEDTVKAVETVTGVEVKKSGSGSDAAPELRRVSDDEKKDLKKGKVAVQPTAPETKAAVFRAGLGDPRVLSNIAEARRGDPAAGGAGGSNERDRAPEAPSGPGFVQTLPFPNAPNPGAQQREEAKREDEEKKIGNDIKDTEQLQSAAKDAQQVVQDAQARLGQQQRQGAVENANAVDEAQKAQERRLQLELEKKLADERASQSQNASLREAAARDAQERERLLREAQEKERLAKAAAEKADREVKEKADKQRELDAAQRRLKELADQLQKELEQKRQKQSQNSGGGNAPGGGNNNNDKDKKGK